MAYSRNFYNSPTIIHQEQIVEVPQVVVEEHVRRQPRHEVQERLIEVPKFEFQERIEYVDVVEYREVPVDKIVEVPEVEYRVREVEHLVPQMFVQEVYMDRYVDVPVGQIQEVTRKEQVPVTDPEMERVKKQLLEARKEAKAAKEEAAIAKREVAEAARMRMKEQVPVTDPAMERMKEQLLEARMEAKAAKEEAAIAKREVAEAVRMILQANQGIISKDTFDPAMNAMRTDMSSAYANYNPGFCRGGPMTAEQASNMFDSLDRDGDGFISKEELVRSIYGTPGLPPSAPEQQGAVSPPMPPRMPLWNSMPAQSPGYTNQPQVLPWSSMPQHMSQRCLMGNSVALPAY